jgi:signal transduction histidine kinase
VAQVDSQAIYRVLLNLVVNAVEACEHNEGSVSILCVCTDQGCTIRISDTGIGIPEAIIPHLSEAFVSSKGSGGTGLGLACSYKIVREHGGDIQVKSQSGTGTIFTVFLPEEQRITQQLRKTSREPVREG